MSASERSQGQSVAFDGFIFDRRTLEARAASGNAPPLRFAAFGARFPWTDDQWKRLKAAAPAAWSLHYQKLDHETHNSMLMLSTYLGLRRLFEPYSKMSAPEFPTTRILPYYGELHKQFGAELGPPQALLRDVLEDLLAEGRGNEARAALNQLKAAYGTPADRAGLARKVADVERRPPPTETVESLLATPMPAASEVRHLMGEWEGETWINPEDRSPITLRIRIENGRAAGEVIQHPAPGEDPAQKLQYLSVQKDGFTWGMMNGVRPRGMLLWEVRGNPEKMEGKPRWGGISFRMEDGTAPPAILVRVRKVN